MVRGIDRATHSPTDHGTLADLVMLNRTNWPRLTGRSRLPALLMVLIVVAAACAASEDDAGARAESADGSAGAGSDISDGSPRLDASTFDGDAVTLDGEAYDLGQLANADLVVWFWAPW